MPSRLLREGIIDSHAVNSLSPTAEVFYRRLMSVVDDYGRFDGRAAVLRSRLYPLQLDKVREADVVRWIAECVNANLIRLYESNGKQYLTFFKLGSPRTKKSKWPAPTDEPPELQMQTDANRCLQTRADVPGSGSGARSGSGSEKPAAPRSGNAEFPGIPPPLDTPEFREAWDDWLGHHREIRKPYKPCGAKALLAKFADMGVLRAVAAIRHSLACNYQGIVEPHHVGRQPGGNVGSDSRVSSPAGKYAHVARRIVTGEVGDAGGPAGQAAVPPQGPNGVED